LNYIILLEYIRSLITDIVINICNYYYYIVLLLIVIDFIIAVIAVISVF